MYFRPELEAVLAALKSGPSSDFFSLVGFAGDLDRERDCELRSRELCELEELLDSLDFDLGGLFDGLRGRCFEGERRCSRSEEPRRLEPRRQERDLERVRRR